MGSYNKLEQLGKCWNLFSQKSLHPTIFLKNQSGLCSPSQGQTRHSLHQHNNNNNNSDSLQLGSEQFAIIRRRKRSFCYSAKSAYNTHRKYSKVSLGRFDIKHENSTASNDHLDMLLQEYFLSVPAEENFASVFFTIMLVQKNIY